MATKPPLGEIIAMPSLVLPDIEAVAALVHRDWIRFKFMQGIVTRKLESGEELMVDYDLLSEEAKELDRTTVRAVYAAIEAASKSS